MAVEWHCLVNDRFGANSSSKHYLSASEVFDHPLKPLTVTVLDNRNNVTARKLSILSKTSSSNSSTMSLMMDPLGGGTVLGGCDPLSLFAKQQDVGEIDPLTKMAEEYNTAQSAKKSVGMDSTDSADAATAAPTLNATAAWNQRRSQILARYTTAERLSIVTSFLTGGEILKHTQSSIADKVRYRLEQLDDCDDGHVVHKMLDLTQHDYVYRIDQLNQELVLAWNCDQRVRSLKIAIQCAKLLADTSVMPFYPSQFVLVTDILDNFGRLVYDRLKVKAFAPSERPPPDQFAPEQVSPAARETCENWFYKIASIRELLPRTFMEIAILRCYAFISQDGFALALQRLTQIVRGIGDPLVAAYVRCYLCRVGMTGTADRAFVKQNLDDMLFVYHTMFTGGIRAEIARQRMDVALYVSLYQPALDWLMQALAAQRDDAVLDNIVKQCQDKKNNGLLLNSILTTFRPSVIAVRALAFVNIIANSTTEGITRAALFRALGECLNHCAPPADQIQPVMSGTWKVIDTLTAADEYCACVEPWSQYVARHGSIAEVDRLMGDAIARLVPMRLFDVHQAAMQSMAEHLVAHCGSFEGLLTTDNFLAFVDLFPKDTLRLEVCKKVLLECRNRSADNAPISDPVVINALMHISRVLSDAVNEMTVDDERRHIGQLIGAFVRRATYGRDIEQQLAFYVDARSAFPNLDATVFVTLVQCVNRLASDTRRQVGGQHNRKTAAFTKACAAYCYITIPSIVSVVARMDLYLLSGQVALQNGCLGQADACFEAALNLIVELPRNWTETTEWSEPTTTATAALQQQRTSDAYLVGYLCSFLATLLVVPDSPERGVLYLPRKLLQCVDRAVVWDATTTTTGGCAAVYLAALDMLTAAAQETYPYRIAGVVSNDELYGAGPKFQAEVNAIASSVVEKLLALLKQLGDAQQMRAQATMALELFGRVAFGADLVQSDKMATLASNLWSLAMKNRGLLDGKLPGKILLKVDRLKERTIDPHRRKVLEELTIKMKGRM